MVSKRCFLVMGYINVAVEFRISMHRILVLNLLLRHKDEEDMLIYFLLTSAQNYTCKGTTRRIGWMAKSNFEKTLTGNRRIIELEGTLGGLLVQTPVQIRVNTETTSVCLALGAMKI